MTEHERVGIIGSPFSLKPRRGLTIVDGSRLPQAWQLVAQNGELESDEILVEPYTDHIVIIHAPYEDIPGEIKDAYVFKRDFRSIANEIKINTGSSGGALFKKLFHLSAHISERKPPEGRFGWQEPPYGHENTDVVVGVDFRLVTSLVDGELDDELKRFKLNSGFARDMLEAVAYGVDRTVYAKERYDPNSHQAAMHIGYLLLEALPEELTEDLQTGVKSLNLGEILAYLGIDIAQVNDDPNTLDTVFTLEDDYGYSGDYRVGMPRQEVSGRSDQVDWLRGIAGRGLNIVIQPATPPKEFESALDRAEDTRRNELSLPGATVRYFPRGDNTELAALEETGEYLSIRDFLRASGWYRSTQSFKLFRQIIAHFAPSQRAHLGLIDYDVPGSSCLTAGNEWKWEETARFMIRTDALVELEESCCKKPSSCSCPQTHIEGVGVKGRELIRAVLYDEGSAELSDFDIRMIEGTL